MDPIIRFKEWFEEAKACRDIVDATAMSLGTADAKGRPSLRMVLLKGLDDGFVFYTNVESRKGADLRANPQAALCFYWASIGKQVRIEGRVEAVSEEEADAYFATRPRESQLGAWASQQSQPLSSREELQAEVRTIDEKYRGQDIPRPPFWSGWRVVPRRMEFWQQGEHRLHDRECYVREGERWTSQRLHP